MFDFSKHPQGVAPANIRGPEIEIVKIYKYLVVYLYLYTGVFLCGSVVEHCVSSAKGCGFDSQGTHILMKMYNLNAIVSRFG